MGTTLISGAVWRCRPCSRRQARRPAKWSIPTKRRSERLTSAERTPRGTPRGVLLLQPHVKLADQLVVVEVVGRLALERNATVHDHVAAVGDADRLIEVLLG